MKGLNTLIRLSKRALDELLRNLVSLENQKEQLQQAIRALQKELENEVALAGRQPEMSNFFGEFAKRIKNRQATLQEEIRDIDKKIAKLNEEISEAYGELKKYEIAKENMIARQKAEAARKETIELDEIAQQQFTRKQEQS